MTFLTQTYELPQTSTGNFMKLQKGENRFRILSPAVTGWLYWDRNNKPVRTKDIPVDIPLDIKPKHFWAMVVYDYKSESIQVLEISQSTVQKSIKGLVEDTDWGEPENYDIKIIKTGELKDTKYQVLGVPHSEVAENIKLEYNAMKVNLQALFESGNPFE